MEKQLKCFTILSLKEMALRRVAAHLWSDSVTLASISKLCSSDLKTEQSRNDWQVIVEDRIKDKLSKLELPNLLKKQMNEVLRPIGLEIHRWKYFHKFYLETEGKVSLPESTKLFWTTEGLIDYQKTAEELVRSDALDVVHCYQLACLNCLEDDIPLIWEKFPEESKRDFHHERTRWLNLTTYWTYLITGELSELDFLWMADGIHSSCNQWAFEYFAGNENKVATKYFFQKMTQEERETSLMRTVKRMLKNKDLQLESIHLFCGKGISSIVCYLFTLLTPKEQMEVIRAHPVAVFLCFFFYPWQGLFLEISGLLWTYVPIKGYIELTVRICFNYPILCFSFPKLFQNFFLQSSVEFRKFCVDHNSGQIFLDFFLYTFLSTEDPESIKVMFRSLNALDRPKLVSRLNISNYFCFCMLRNRWHLVKICLQEAMLSVEDKKKLKCAFKHFLESRENDETVNQKFKACFEFLDQTDAGVNKQKVAQKRKLGNCPPE